jgi:beta-glucanase (GH16 family)
VRNNSLGLKPAIKWLLFFALLTGTALAAPPTGYKLVFTDEFNSDSLDTLRWIDRYPWGRTHNHDAYVAPENVLLGDGTLTLRAERRAQGGKPFTSGTISSGYNKYTFNGGYAEARILLPETPGSWPAFWGLYTGWPPEADIMEYPIRAVGTQG